MTIPIHTVTVTCPWPEAMTGLRRITQLMIESLRIMLYLAPQTPLVCNGACGNRGLCLPLRIECSHVERQVGQAAGLPQGG